MAFLYPLGEIVIEGIEAGLASNMGKEIINSFAPKIKDGIIDLTGKQIAAYAAAQPTGFVAKTINKAYKYANYANNANYANIPREKTHHSHRHKRAGHRRTR